MQNEMTTLFEWQIMNVITKLKFYDEVKRMRNEIAKCQWQIGSEIHKQNGKSDKLNSVHLFLKSVSGFYYVASLTVISCFIH